jgi:hypothetical protein
MLWMTCTSQRMLDNDTFSEALLKQQYLAMKEVAETVYSPVGVLDLASGTVFAYDLDTMTLGIT